MGYKNLSKEELKKLPLDKLAEIAHEALQNWDRLNQRLNQDSTNSGRAPSTDSPETRAKRKAEQESKTVRHGARKQGAQVGHKGIRSDGVDACGIIDGSIFVRNERFALRYCGKNGASVWKANAAENTWRRC